MKLRERGPMPSLRPFVDRFWWLEGAGSREVDDGDPVLPDGRCELVVHRGAPFAARRGGVWSTQPRALFVGQQVQAVTLRPTGSTEAFGVRFTPAGAIGLLGPRAQGEPGRLESIELALPGLGARCSELVLAAPDFATAIAAVEPLLVAELCHATLDASVLAALVRLDSGAGDPSIGALATGLGLSMRQLERRFGRAVGLPPKRFARIRRAHGLLERLRASPGAGGADAAFAAGYADQAHAIREVRELAGVSPAKLLADPPRLTALLAGWIDAA